MQSQVFVLANDNSITQGLLEGLDKGYVVLRLPDKLLRFLRRRILRGVFLTEEAAKDALKLAQLQTETTAKPPAVETAAKIESTDSDFQQAACCWRAKRTTPCGRESGCSAGIRCSCRRRIICWRRRRCCRAEERAAGDAGLPAGRPSEAEAAGRVHMRVDRIETDPQPIVGSIVVVAVIQIVVMYDTVDHDVALGLDLGGPGLVVHTLHWDVPHWLRPAVVPVVEDKSSTPSYEAPDVAESCSPAALLGWSEPPYRTLVDVTCRSWRHSQSSTVQPAPPLSAQCPPSSAGFGLPERNKLKT